MFGAVVYLVFGTGEIQSWAQDEESLVTGNGELSTAEDRDIDNKCFNLSVTIIPNKIDKTDFTENSIPVLSCKL